MPDKILIISYHFPPSQAVGGLRAANFASLLPRSGWQVHVLTIKDKYIADQDQTRLEGLGEVTLYKTSKLPKLMTLYSTGKALLRQALARHGRPEKPAVAPAVGGSRATGQEKFWQRAKRYYASLFLALPDYEKNWIVPAAIKGLALVRRHKYRCILTSCPPYSAHLVGLIIERATGVRWVADYRDPWYAASKKRMYPTSLLSRKIEGLLEKEVMKRASLVLCNTERLRDTLADAYRQVKGSGFVYIPNGISTDVFRGLRHLRKAEKFTITYTGSLYFFRTPEPVFKALRALIDEGRIDEETFVVKLIGHCQMVDDVPTASLVARYSLEKNVEVLPPVSYRESLAEVKKSHLALLLAPDQPFQIPAKVYDYIGTGTRILALAGDGATADIIVGTDTGNVFRPDDHAGLKTFLHREMTAPRSVDEGCTAAAIARFDRQRVVKDFAGRLEDFLQADRGDVR